MRVGRAMSPMSGGGSDEGSDDVAESTETETSGESGDADG